MLFFIVVVFISDGVTPRKACRARHVDRMPEDMAGVGAIYVNAVLSAGRTAPSRRRFDIVGKFEADDEPV